MSMQENNYKHLRGPAILSWLAVLILALLPMGARAQHSVTVETATGGTVTADPAADVAANKLVTLSVNNDGGILSGITATTGNETLTLSQAKNLLVNGDCSSFDGWTFTSGSYGGNSHVVVESNTTDGYNFHFSYSTDVFQQTVDLLSQGFTEAQLDAEPSFFASAQLQSGMGSRIAKVEIKALDADGGTLSTITLLDDNSNISSWKTYEQAFTLPVGTRKLTYIVSGRDAVYWNGHYGPQFRNLNLSVGTKAPSDKWYYFFMPDADVTVTPAFTTYFSEGDCTEANPWQISSVEEWNHLAEYVALGGETSGKFFKLKNSIEGITTMVGTDDKPFNGIFDGNGKTLTVDITATTENSGPFKTIDGATIKNLTTAGTVTSSAKCIGGLAGRARGTITIDNCHSTVTVNSTVNGDGTHGGFIGNGDAQLTFKDCAFTGTIQGSSTTCCGGFVGWRQNSATVNLNNCLFAGTWQLSSTSECATFARNGVSNITNGAYYVNGVSKTEWNQGRLVYTSEPDRYSEVLTFFGTNYYLSPLKVTVATVTGGTVTASTTPEANTTVTLTATPDDGYQLDYVEVKGSTTTPTVTNGHWYESGDITFTMPEEDVTVTPHFKQLTDEWSVNIPQTGTLRVILPAWLGKLKVYDNGGKDGHYSNSCEGYLYLTSPEGTQMHLSGTAATENKVYDYLQVSESTDFSNAAKQGSINTGTTVSVKDLVTQGQTLNLYFHSDGSMHYAGLDLIVEVGYSITYELNGGTTNGNNPDFYNVAEDKTLLVPTKEGYIFDGWFDNAELTGDAITTIPKGATGAKTFYAKWTLLDPSTYFTAGDGTEASPWQIGSLDDWNKLVDYVAANGFTNGKYFKLMDNIEGVTTPVGDASHPFRGTFDGNGRKMTLNITTPAKAENNDDAQKGWGPFRFTDGATIKNLWTAGTITCPDGEGDLSIGGIIGRTIGSAPTTLSNCRSSVVIDMSAQASDRDFTAGGFIGQTFQQSATIDNCLFDGVLKGSNAMNNGGIVGWSAKETTISNTVQAGSFSTNNEGCGTFSRNATLVTLDNCYYLNDYSTTEHNKYKSGTPTKLTDDNMATNAAKLPTTYWTYEGLDYPQLTMFAPKSVTSISSLSDWNAFSTSVAEGRSYKGVTVTLADNVNDVQSMAGTEARPFKGTFDGNGKTLTVNINGGSKEMIAPFSNVSGATIKNLKVTGTVTSAANHTSGLVGSLSGNVTINNVEVAATVNNTNGGHAGGFIGHGQHATATISNSAFTGTLIASNNGAYFVGWGESDCTANVSNSLANPSSTPTAGNIWDFVCTKQIQNKTVTNCYYTANATKVNSGENQGTAATADALKNGTTASSLQGSQTSEIWIVDPTNTNGTTLKTFAAAAEKTIDSDGYSSYYNSVAWTVPTGLKVRYVKSLDFDNKYAEWETISEGQDVPAGTAVIMKGTGSETYTLNFARQSTAEAPADNYLKGSDLGTTPEANDAKYFYKFSYSSKEHKDGTLGFYWGAENGAPFASGAHKVWLEADKSKFPAGAKDISGFQLNFDDDTTTGISFISDTHQDGESWYTISGQKLSGKPAASGIYINNGRKVIIK